MALVHLRKQPVPVLKTGVGDGARTHDRRNHNPELCQLSYAHQRLSTFSRAILTTLGAAEYPHRRGAPGRTRTCNPRLRRPVLCPVELRAHCFPALPVPCLVGVEGFEPPTHCSQSNCATRLRYTPTSPEPVNCRNFTALQQTGFTTRPLQNTFAKTKIAPTRALSPLYSHSAFQSGAPGEIRTPDLLVRSQTLYPTELRAHFFWAPCARLYPACKGCELSG